MEMPKKLPIKIAMSAGKDVFLYPTGVVQCGRVSYTGKLKRKFQRYFDEIDGHLRKYNARHRDVSDFQVMFIGDLLAQMELKWQRTITIDRIRRLAEQSDIREMTNDISHEFMRYLN